MTRQPRVGRFFHLLFGLAACASLVASSVARGERDWPFYVPQNIVPPTIEDEWVRNDIDKFIFQKLRLNRLSPAPEAPKRTLIRRLYFDIIGLPPTPEDIRRFLDDTSVDAYARLVDRLLGDARYGERWARFWLDLARYADTAGYEGDPDLPHAWRYRDYVIDALNNDKPYDLFIREQIAGDEFQEIMGAGELPNTPAERIVAMTFLRLAPFTEPRGDETRHEMLSEITSTVGSVFLGLTVGCAKCHDHKHDEIPTADFYRMKAFFATISIPPPKRGDGFQIGGSLEAEFYREGQKEWAAATRAQLENEAASAETELAKLKQTISDRLQTETEAGAGFGIQAVTNGNDYLFDKQSVNDGNPHWAVVNSDGEKWTIYVDGGTGPTGSLSGENKGQWFASITSPSHISLGQHTSGTGTPEGASHEGKFAEIMIFDRPLDRQSRQTLASYFEGVYGANRGQPVPSIPSGVQFRLHAADLDGAHQTKNPQLGRPVSRWVDVVSGIELTQDDANLQPKLATMGGAPAVEFSNSFMRGMVENAEFLNNKSGAIAILFSATHGHEGYGFEVGGSKQFVTTYVNPSASRNDNDPVGELIQGADPRITKQERQRYEYLSTRDRFTKQHLTRLEPVAMSLRHSFGPPYEPGVPVSRIMIRGEYDNPGDVVEPGFPSVITGNQNPADIRLDPFKRWPTRSRRMALAKWIASPNNPMTARVMANRLWHQHFGQGIVRTPSDFGDLSGGPSHQELLDWLAVRFVEEKWSIKAMHRLILNSATYRQSSARADRVASEKDPDNRLLWRFNRRRLEAEAVRDNVLAVSGRLNDEKFGLPIFPPLPGDVAETVKYTESKWDTQYGPEGRRRSLYVYQQRTLTMPLMQTFDGLVCEETRPRRPSSVTPLQALAMYNGAFVNEEAKHFAKRVDAIGTDERQKVRHAFEIALGRLPDDNELNTLSELMDTVQPVNQGMAAVCRVLLNTNEFLYVD